MTIQAIHTAIWSRPAAPNKRSTTISPPKITSAFGLAVRKKLRLYPRGLHETKSMTVGFNLMTKVCFSFLFLAAAALLPAATPSPEKLLPADTVLVVTTPDWSATRKASERAAFAQLWNDS